jgi:hypothetical protein
MLSQWLASWTAVYADYAWLRTVIAFAHVGGLLAAGGLAVGADRMVLRMKRPDAGSAESALRHDVGLKTLEGIHQIVVGGLVLVLASGVLLLCADLETFLYAKVFWLKMALFALLLMNGVILTRQEQRVVSGQLSAWRPLRLAATTSLTLWFLTTLLGVALPNLG